MRYFVIFLSIICVGFFIWAGAGNRKWKKKEEKDEEKPLFHTEDEKEEYGKSMDTHPVDFDDAE